VCPGTGGFEGLAYVFQHSATFDGAPYEIPVPMVVAMPSAATE
jgi:hypothetical protein